MNMKAKAGDKYVCTFSASPGYKVGRVYEAYKNATGVVCFMGSDGFEDKCSELVSAFKPYDDKSLRVVT